MIEKKYCVDYDSTTSNLEVDVKGNKISYDDDGYNFYKLYVWQQELINSILEGHDKAILSINYINLDTVRDIVFDRHIDIYYERVISNQCHSCLKRQECDKYKKMLKEDPEAQFETNEQLYNLYLLFEAKASAFNDAKENLRKIIDAKIESGGGVMSLEKLGLELSISETSKDKFPFDIALKNNLLNEKNCKILIGQMRKDIKGTEYQQEMIKVSGNKKLQIDHIK